MRSSGNGIAIDLGVWPGGDYSVANGINNLGQIVGTGTVAGDNLDHALMWTVDDGSGNTTPSPRLRAKPNRIHVGESVSVQASFVDPDNGPWSYTLDWGDGTSSTGETSVA
jgi:probable HAF family extracellular repeat protein